MLITFRVSNFLSFNEEVELSMQAGQQRNLPSHYISTGTGRNDVNILKTAVIYGANASGKSNLIKAMDFAQKVMLNGIKSETTYNKYFRLDPANINKPSTFEFEFKLDDKIYAYGFSLHLDNKKIQEEWLIELGKTTENPIFERKILPDGQSEFTKFNLKLTDKKAITRFEVYKEDILNTQLFLTEISNKDFRDRDLFYLRRLFVHLTSSIVILFPNSQFHGNFLETDSFSKFLKHFTGISGIGAKTLTKDEIAQLYTKNDDLEKLIEPLAKDRTLSLNLKINDEFQKILIHKNLVDGQLVFHKMLIKHIATDGNPIGFDVEDESDGTRRIMDFIPMFSIVSDFPAIFVIDEIDRSLHPELTRKILETFLTTTEGIESQLIVSTHESSLLDLNLLRRDEIWFTEKDTNGATKLYSLEEFKPRHDTELRKAYLTGRFGAIPFISNVKSLGWLKDKSLETAPSV
jgi:uncharacterized protein